MDGPGYDSLSRYRQTEDMFFMEYKPPLCIFVVVFFQLDKQATNDTNALYRQRICMDPPGCLRISYFTDVIEND